MNRDLTRVGLVIKNSRNVMSEDASCSTSSGISFGSLNSIKEFNL